MATIGCKPAMRTGSRVSLTVDIWAGLRPSRRGHQLRESRSLTWAVVRRPARPSAAGRVRSGRCPRSAVARHLDCPELRRNGTSMHEKPASRVFVASRAAAHGTREGSAKDGLSQLHSDAACLVEPTSSVPGRSLPSYYSIPTAGHFCPETACHHPHSSCAA